MTETGTGPVFGADRALVSQRDGGGFLVRNAATLGKYPQNSGAWIRHWSAVRPDGVFIADRTDAPTDARTDAGKDGGWRSWTWAEARSLIDRLSAGLLARGLGADSPVAILSDKSGRSGLLTFAAMQVGIPVAPLSPNWSLMPAAEGRLRHALSVVRPGLIVAETEGDYDRALDICASAAPDAQIAVIGAETAGRTGWPDLTAADDASTVDTAFDTVTAGTLAKIMFTSGSTGLPKAVRVTHGNMTSNQQALRQMLPCLAETPPVVVDWQPWHHCGGGCYNWHAAVANGGSYYCDPGRPTADGIAGTVDALRGLSPTIHFNVPLGYDLLFGALQADDGLRAGFFRNLRVLVYSAASMPDALWERAVQHAVRPDGTPVPMISAYGMTEMAPMHTMVCRPMEEPNQIGIPAPGCDVRLGPFVGDDGEVAAGRYEMLAKGPNVTPGYYRDPAATAAAFDADGWFRSGDLVRFIDPGAPAKGLRLDGRAVEQFKLQSGTWVSVNEVRLSLIAALQPLVRDAIIAGEGRKELGAILVLDPADRRPRNERDAWIGQRLDGYNRTQQGSSRRVPHVAVLKTPLSVALGEVTDKGSINQRLALANRPDEVAALFARGQRD